MCCYDKSFSMSFLSSYYLVNVKANKVTSICLLSMACIFSAIRYNQCLCQRNRRHLLFIIQNRVIFSCCRLSMHCLPCDCCLKYSFRRIFCYYIMFLDKRCTYTADDRVALVKNLAIRSL